MPRGQKSKLRARAKRSPGPKRDQRSRGCSGYCSRGRKLPSSASPLLGDRSQNLPTAGTRSTPKSPQRAAGVSCADSNEGANSQNEESSDESYCEDPLNEKVVLLVEFLLRKYQEKEPITKADMLKSVIKNKKYQFPEILKRASEHMELAFGIDLKEVDPIRHCYTFVNKLDLTADDMVIDEEKTPKTGLLMIVLAVIFKKGNCATEEEVWKVLNLMGVYAGKKHSIYGEPKKVLTQELVQMKYLEYRQVPNSDPPRYEFLWGPRARVETSKMKVLEFLAKVHDTTPSAFPSCYEEAMKDEEERARARIEARAHSSAMASARAKAKPSSSSCPK